MLNRAFAAIVGVQLILAGCSRVPAGGDTAANGNSGNVAARSDPRHVHYPHDNVVRIPPAGKDLEAADQRIDLGPAKQGKLFRVPLELANLRAEPIKLDHFTASCECFSLAGLPLKMPAKRRTKIGCSVDLATDPDFHGDLAIEVHLQSGGKDVSIFTVALHVERDRP